jgi:uncharacterized protein
MLGYVARPLEETLADTCAIWWRVGASLRRWCAACRSTLATHLGRAADHARGMSRAPRSRYAGPKASEAICVAETCRDENMVAFRTSIAKEPRQMSMFATKAASTQPPDPRPGAPRVVPRARVPHLGFHDLPRHWFAGSAVATHVANGLNLVIPMGERFFVRSVRHYLDRLADPELEREVRGFMGQEGRHAQAHERFMDGLRKQGYAIDGFLPTCQRLLYDIPEKVLPPSFRLAVTGALEHFTAIIAEDTLVNGVLQGAHPASRHLFEWHALEELEHKAVAFDVLRMVHPSYALRMAGLVYATVGLAIAWLAATRVLLAQDGITLWDAAKELRALERAAHERGARQDARLIFTRIFARGIRDYVRRDFHPMDRDHAGLIRAALERLRSEGVVDDVGSAGSAHDR